MIFVLTMFIKIPVASGYIHFGDALIYLASLIIGPWAVIAGIIGEGLVDLISYPMYVPATVIIKAVLALLFLIIKNKSSRLLNVYSALMTVPAALVTVGGYLLADMLIDKSFAVVDIPGNIIQAGASAVIFIILAAALDRVNIKDKIDF